MPERQIPWRRVAETIGGSLQVRTGLQSSHFHVSGRVAGLAVVIDGLSNPYSASGGSTSFRVSAPEPLRASLRVHREGDGVPLYQRLLHRDVIIGDDEFDRGWIINAQREAQAQAFLNRELRDILAAIPAAKMEGFGGVAWPGAHYGFELRGRRVSARSSNFERDVERMMSAIHAAVALALRPHTLLQEYKSLATLLGGTLHSSGSFTLDGRVTVRFAGNGRALSVSPLSVQTGWRRDRLRTRISCDHATHVKLPATKITRVDELRPWVPDMRLASQAMVAAEIVSAKLSSRRVRVDLDGQVIDPERVRAAGYLAASLSQGSAAGQGPYR